MKRKKKIERRNTEEVIYKKYFDWTLFLCFDKVKDRYSKEMFEAVRKNKYLYSHSEKAIDDVEKLMDMCLRMAIFISGEMIISVSEDEDFVAITIKDQDLQMIDKALYYLSNIAMFCSSITFLDKPEERNCFQMIVLYDFSDENPDVKDTLIEKLTSEYKSNRE
jgi:hypothetical protein